MPPTDIAGLARDVLREEWEPSSDSAQFLANSAPALARQVQADAKRIEELEAVLEQLSECDLNDTNCASFDVANRRIRAIARAALQAKEQPHDQS